MHVHCCIIITHIVADDFISFCVRQQRLQCQVCLILCDRCKSVVQLRFLPFKTARVRNILCMGRCEEWLYLPIALGYSALYN